MNAVTDSEHSGVGPPPGHYTQRGASLARWLFVPLVILLVSLILILSVFFSTSVVEGESMVPTLLNGDYVLITHRQTELMRGDIIEISVPEPEGSVRVVKRVIGLPGDSVEVRNDVAYVNGVAEPSRGQQVRPEFSVSRPTFVVPKGSIYVMGDNRAVSLDSRYYGPVPLAGLDGRGVLVFAPIGRVRILN